MVVVGLWAMMKHRLVAFRLGTDLLSEPFTWIIRGLINRAFLRSGFKVSDWFLVSGGRQFVTFLRKENRVRFQGSVYLSLTATCFWIALPKNTLITVRCRFIYHLDSLSFVTAAHPGLCWNIKHLVHVSDFKQSVVNTKLRRRRSCWSWP